MKKLTLIVMTVLFSLGLRAQAGDSTYTCGIFGIGCYFSGAPQESILRMIKLVNNGDKQSLLQWARSDNAQNQMHGIVGLYFLKRNDSTLSREEEQLIKAGQRSSVQVNFCEGCTEGPYASMATLLTTKRLKWYYKWFATHGYKNYP